MDFLNENGSARSFESPPQPSPLTDVDMDQGDFSSGSPGSKQVDDWIDWMKWEDKDGEIDTTIIGEAMETELSSAKSADNEAISTGSPISMRSFLQVPRPTMSPRLDKLSPRTQESDTSSSNTRTTTSPRTVESRTSFESTLPATEFSGLPSILPMFESVKPPGPTRKRKAPLGDLRRNEPATPAESKDEKASKRPHNMVERRYRNNLNEKIAALRDSVPSLRVTKTLGSNAQDDTDNNDDNEASASSQKLNKGSILSKATDYIQHLELRARRLDEENIALKTRLRGLEKIIEQRDMAAPQPNTPVPAVNIAAVAESNLIEANMDESTGQRPSSPKGLIPVPEAMRRLRMRAPQAHYADQFLNRTPSSDGPDSGAPKSRGKFMNRLMIGSLAGLMVVDSYATRKSGDGKSRDRGLMAIPIDLICELLVRIHFSEVSSLFPMSRFHLSLLPLVRLFLALNVLAFVVFVYLFSSKPMGPGHQSNSMRFGAALSLSSPIGIRRQAFFSSLDTIWIPEHSLLKEFFATSLEALKYFIRYLVGWSTYSRITGRTEEYEVARRKALDILIDAQLAGGDPQISRSRLVLTIFASGTLPNNAHRSMIKALHARIILWRVGRAGSFTCRLADAASMKVARYQWGLAQKFAKSSVADVGEGDDLDQLPHHLESLLQYDCTDVLRDSIIQRAYNLAWDRPASENIDTEDMSMNAVVEDAAVRSPLDAIASWWSTSVLNEALVHHSADRQHRAKLAERLEIASSTAPTSSAAQSRALAAEAVFLQENRASTIDHVLRTLPSRKPSMVTLQSSPYVPTPNIFSHELPEMASREIGQAIRCAIIIAFLEDGETPQLRRLDVTKFLRRISIKQQDLTYLTFASTLKLLESVQSDQRLSRLQWKDETRRALRHWTDSVVQESPKSFREYFLEIRNWLSDRCVDVKPRKARRWSHDTGYGSQSESDLK